MTLLTTLRN